MPAFWGVLVESELASKSLPRILVHLFYYQFTLHISIEDDL